MLLGWVRAPPLVSVAPLYSLHHSLDHGTLNLSAFPARLVTPEGRNHAEESEAAQQGG